MLDSSKLRDVAVEIILLQLYRVGHLIAIVEGFESV